MAVTGTGTVQRGQGRVGTAAAGAVCPVGAVPRRCHQINAAVMTRKPMAVRSIVSPEPRGAKRHDDDYMDDDGEQRRERKGHVCDMPVAEHALRGLEHARLIHQRDFL